MNGTSGEKEGCYGGVEGNRGEAWYLLMKRDQDLQGSCLLDG